MPGFRRAIALPGDRGALFLSTNTIGFHLRNIFHKLDVSSRVEVARVVEQAEGAGNPSA